MSLIKRGIDLIKNVENLKNCITIDKWAIYQYSQVELDYAIENHIPILYNYGMDYPLYVETIKEILKKRGYKELKNKLYTTEYYNFEILGIDSSHPDRTHEHSFLFSEYKEVTIRYLNMPIQCTSIKLTEGKYFSPVSLCTHTTSQIWEMLSKTKLLYPTFIIGTVFRRETEDATHSIEFDNLDLCKSPITYEQLVNELTSIFKQLNIDVLIRRTRYPYVSPAIEGYVSKLDREIEVFGAGIFTPQLLKQVGINDTVLGAGIGLSRLFLYMTNRSKLSHISDL